MPGCQDRNGIRASQFPIQGAAENLADLVGAAISRTSCVAGLWGFVSLRAKTDDRRRRELEQAVAQRNAELLQKNKELEDISLTDPLTVTRNRRYFYETIPTDVAQALRSHLKTAGSGACRSGQSKN